MMFFKLLRIFFALLILKITDREKIDQLIGVKSLWNAIEWGKVVDINLVNNVLASILTIR